MELIIFIVGILVFTPIFGRFFAAQEREHGRRSDQVSPMIAGIAYGVSWPLSIILVVIAIAWAHRHFLRKIITGE